MITVLLQQILDLLTTHFPGVISLLEKLNLIEPDVEEIRQDVDIIRNTANTINSNVQMVYIQARYIKDNTDLMKADTANISTKTDLISNNISTISTNTGRAASFAEDCANNTLDIDQKITSIASDTTQMRADNQTLISNTNDLETILALGMSKDINQDAGSFETDLNNNLKSLIVQIPADSNGISGLNIIKTKKNILGGNRFLSNSQAYMPSGTTDLVNKTFEFQASATVTTGLSFTNNLTFKPNTVYTIIIRASKNAGSGSNLRIYYTDGTYTALGSFSEFGVKTTFVVTTNPNKTFSRILKTNSSNRTTLYYEECGIFEGELTEADFVPYEEETTPISFASITDGGKLDVTNGHLFKPDLTVETIPPVNVRADIGYNFIYSDIGLLNFTYEESMSKYLTEINNA